jgi:hypothetical protein
MLVAELGHWRVQRDQHLLELATLHADIVTAAVHGPEAEVNHPHCRGARQSEWLVRTDDDIRENGGAVHDVQAVLKRRRTSRPAAASAERRNTLGAIDGIAVRGGVRFVRRLSVHNGRYEGRRERALLAIFNV